MEVGEAIMVILFLIVFIGFIISFIYTKHLHVDFNSFFRKGFKKLDSLFRNILLYRKATELEKLTVLLSLRKKQGKNLIIKF